MDVIVASGPKMLWFPYYKHPMFAWKLEDVFKDHLHLNP